VDDTVEREFTEFVTDRAHVLLQVAYALTGDQHAAEDLLQGALAKAFARWRHIEGAPEAYVRRILYRDHVSAWRRFGRREIPVADPPDRAAADQPGPDAALRLAVSTALLALPPRQRAVLVLRYLEDRSLEETAALLGCSTGTVASQASRALAKLRALVPGLAELTDRPRPVAVPAHADADQDVPTEVPR